MVYCKTCNLLLFVLWFPFIKKNKLCATIRVLGPNLLVAIMYALHLHVCGQHLHVCSQHLFGLPLRMNEVYGMQSDPVRFDHYWHVPLVTSSCMFWSSDHTKMHFILVSMYSAYGDIFVSYWRKDRHFRKSPEPCKDLAIYRAIKESTVKPLLSGHPWEKARWPRNGGWPLNRSF